MYKRTTSVTCCGVAAAGDECASASSEVHVPGILFVLESANLYREGSSIMPSYGIAVDISCMSG